MTITSAPVRSTPAISAKQAHLTSLPAKVDAGAFTRSGESAMPIQADQGIGSRIAALFRSSEPTPRAALSTTAESLKTIADVYGSTAFDGELLHMKTFGKPAMLTGLNGCMVLKSKYSTDPSEPTGLLGFKNGEVVFAKSGHSGVSLTPKQQDTMVAAALEALVSADVRRS